MTTFNDLNDATYVSIESFRKNGTSVKTPVWITADDGKLYCWTGLDSWKVKRIRNNPQVNLAICDRVGTIESDWVSATGEVLDDPEAMKAQHRRLVKKYGLMFRLFQLMSIIQRNKQAVIAFSPVK